MRVLFASDAGGVGLNLQRAASACINLELPWNPAVLEQRIGRIHRIGQEQPVDVYNLVSSYGIEARISAVVGNKKALFDGLFDGTSDVVDFDQGRAFMTQLEKIVAPVSVPEVSNAVEEPEAALELSDEVPVREELETQTGSLPPQSEVKALLSEMRVKRSLEGGISIDAPPAVASTLVDLFEGIATMLRESK